MINFAIHTLLLPLFKGKILWYSVFDPVASDSFVFIADQSKSKTRIFNCCDNDFCICDEIKVIALAGLFLTCVVDFLELSFVAGFVDLCEERFVVVVLGKESDVYWTVLNIDFELHLLLCVNSKLLFFTFFELLFDKRIHHNWELWRLRRNHHWSPSLSFSLKCDQIVTVKTKSLIRSLNPQEILTVPSIFAFGAIITHKFFDTFISFSFYNDSSTLMKRQNPKTLIFHMMVQQFMFLIFVDFNVNKKPSFKRRVHLIANHCVIYCVVAIVAGLNSDVKMMIFSLRNQKRTGVCGIIVIWTWSSSFTSFYV